MRIAGNYNFTSPSEEVWAALHDLDVLFHTIPGCQRIERISEDAFDYTLTIPLLAVRGTYSGQSRLEDISAPYHCRFMLDSSSTEGTIQGEGMITLREEGDLTIMDYGCEFHFGGAIADVSRELLDDAAKVLINQGLRTLARHIEMRALLQAASSASVPTNGGLPKPDQLTPASAMPTVDHTATGEPATRSRHSSFVVPQQKQHSEPSGTWERVRQFFCEMPWFLWLPAAFLIGYGCGRNRRVRANPGSKPDVRAVER